MRRSLDPRRGFEHDPPIQEATRGYSILRLGLKSLGKKVCRIVPFFQATGTRCRGTSESLPSDRVRSNTLTSSDLVRVRLGLHLGIEIDDRS